MPRGPNRAIGIRRPFGASGGPISTGAPVPVPALDGGFGHALSAPWARPDYAYSHYNHPRFNPVALLGPQYSEDFFVYTTPAVSLAPGATAITNFQISGDSAFEWIASTVSANNANFSFNGPNINIQITDGGSGRNMFSQPVPVALVAGGALFTTGASPEGCSPHVLPVSKKFIARSQVNVALTNFDTVNTWAGVQFSFLGRKLYSGSRGDFFGKNQIRYQSWIDERGRTFCQDYYAYVLNLSTLAAGASAALQTTIDADSDFEWIDSIFGSQAGSTSTSLGSGQWLTGTITDGGSQRALSNNPTPLTNQAGSGGFPFILPVPRILLSRTTVQLALTNPSAVAANNFYLLLEGRKIFEAD